eukprot:scaffold619_cov403-Prasinococcus_capsulatus_cf.AAC.4
MATRPNPRPTVPAVQGPGGLAAMSDPPQAAGSAASGRAASWQPFAAGGAPSRSVDRSLPQARAKFSHGPSQWLPRA